MIRKPHTRYLILRLLVCVFPLASLNCLATTTTTREHEIHVRTEKEQSDPIWSKPKLEVKIKGDAIHARAREQPFCDFEKQLKYRSDITSTTTLESRSFWLQAVSAGLASVAGGYLLATASQRPDINDPYSRDELSSQGASALGGLILGVGLIPAAGALRSLLVTGDRTEAGPIEMRTGNEWVAKCGKYSGRAGEIVELRLPGAAKLTRATSKNGVATFKLSHEEIAATKGVVATLRYKSENQTVNLENLSSYQQIKEEQAAAKLVQVKKEAVVIFSSDAVGPITKGTRITGTNLRKLFPKYSVRAVAFEIEGGEHDGFEVRKGPAVLLSVMDFGSTLSIGSSSVLVATDRGAQIGDTLSVATTLHAGFTCRSDGMVGTTCSDPIQPRLIFLGGEKLRSVRWVAKVPEDVQAERTLAKLGELREAGARLTAVETMHSSGAATCFSSPDDVQGFKCYFSSSRVPIVARAGSRLGVAPQNWSSGNVLALEDVWRWVDRKDLATQEELRRAERLKRQKEDERRRLLELEAVHQRKLAASKRRAFERRSRLAKKWKVPDGCRIMGADPDSAPQEQRIILRDNDFEVVQQVEFALVSRMSLDALEVLGRISALHAWCESGKKRTHSIVDEFGRNIISCRVINLRAKFLVQGVPCSGESGFKK